MDTADLRAFLAGCSRHLTIEIIPAGRRSLNARTGRYSDSNDDPLLRHCADLLGVMEIHAAGMQQCADMIHPDVTGQTIAHALGHVVGGMNKGIGLSWGLFIIALNNPDFSTDPALELVAEFVTALNDTLLALEACIERFGGLKAATLQ